MYLLPRSSLLMSRSSQNDQEEKLKRAALYLRISTKNHGQTTDTQALALREYAERRGFQIVDEYADEGISGAKDRRPQLDRLMADARKRRFDVVIVARFDRFARSVSHLLRALEEFDQLGVDFVSLSESIDTSTAVGKMIFTVLGAVGELERSIIRERVQAGVDRARRQGKRFGRPAVIVDRERIRHCAAAGQSIKSLAKEWGIARATVRDILGRARVAKRPAKTAALSR
jgi:DNA invertase Pin-like site-specific DNA recombinase